jgi:hypothetical protein
MMPTWQSVSVPMAQQQPPSAYGYSIAQPAFTAVQVRQSFGQSYPPPAQYPPPPNGVNGYAASSFPPPPVTNPYAQPGTSLASSEPQPPAKKIDWPESVRNYVQRSFLPGNLDPTVPRNEMEAKLKETISTAKDTGVLYTLDWDAMPLPQQIIKSERSKALQPVGRVDSPPSSVAGPPSRKRKSTDLTDDAATPARRANQNRGALQDRTSYPPMDKRSQTDTEPSSKISKFQKQLEKRQKRFDGGYKSTYRDPSPEPSDGPIIGTCQTLEKHYLRLTSAPNPAQVRPESVLRQTLELLKSKWRKENNYSYICDQFKSMRQDLTVQRIRNDFTVSVYEIHARIALEKGDLGEYNQCQTQLRALYQLGLKGNPIEFKAYRILYFIYSANRTALNDAIADLTGAEKQERAIKHALDVRSALALGNYHRFFQLYLDTPNMGAYLMDMFVARERLAALSSICKVYKPDIKLRFITEELGFESDVDALQFVIDHGGEHLIEQRDDYFVFLSGKAGPLFETAKATAFSKVDLKGQI